MKEVVLFKCSWFNPTLRVGTIIHPQYKLIDVHKNRAFIIYELFILETHATQVFYAPYPSLTRYCNVWFMICSIKTRSIVKLAESHAYSIIPTFQANEVQIHEFENKRKKYL